PAHSPSTLSLHDALPICRDQAHRHHNHPLHLASSPGPSVSCCVSCASGAASAAVEEDSSPPFSPGSGPAFFEAGFCSVIIPDRPDRKSTRLNSSHVKISY